MHGLITLSDAMSYDRNAIYISCSVFSICLKVWTTERSAISFVSSESKSALCSVKGLPRSSSVSTGHVTFRWKVRWVLLFCSWWFFVTSALQRYKASKSLNNRDISGPATIQHFRAPRFSVRPTAPPSDLTRAIFCSWARFNTSPENLFLVLWTTKRPSRILLPLKDWGSVTTSYLSGEPEAIWHNWCDSLQKTME